MQSRLATATNQVTSENLSLSVTRRDEVDEAISLFAHEVNDLDKSADNGGSLEAALSQYQAAADSMSDFSSMLSNLAIGLPSDVVQLNVQDANTTVSALDASIACFENVSPFTANPCAAEGSVLTADASQSGAALKDLAPYWSRSDAQISALFGTPSASS